MDPSAQGPSSSDANGRSDEELVKLYQMGDISAYEELFRRYNRRIQLYTSTFVGVDNADDMAQNVFIKVFDAIRTTKEIKNFSAWIHRVAKNLSIDHLRHKNLIDWLSWREQKEFNEIESMHVAGPELKVEEEDCARNAWMQVSPQYRTCLYYDIVEGWPQREISSELGISDRTVRRYISQGKEELLKAYRLLETNEKEEH